MTAPAHSDPGPEPERLPPIPRQPPWYKRGWAAMLDLEQWIIDFFEKQNPTALVALTPLLLLALVLYTRHPATNYIFDEQEALLANPFVNAAQGLKFGDVIHRDFWGLPPDASIGSYRPLPNVIWRATWGISKHPFFHHLYNIVIHALNGALLSAFILRITRRRAMAWLTGATFVSAAVLTEAVSGIVGIADVLGGLGAILALLALCLDAAWMPLGVFGAMTLGLFSKESALVCVPLVPVAAVLLAPHTHPQRPARLARGLLALVAAAGAFVLYVELRKVWFPSPLPEALQKPLPEHASTAERWFRELLVWFRQAPLPKDPLNNPLAEADGPHRLAGALRVYWRGLVQVLVPARLSGDYSFPQEPVPTTLSGWETVAGGLAMILPLATAPALWVVALLRERRDRRRLVPASSALGSALANLDPPAGQPRLELPLVELPPVGWKKKKLRVALAVVVAGAAGLGAELWLVHRGGPSWVRTWPFTLALLVVGLGGVVDGWRAVARPMAPSGPWPLRHLAPPLAAIAMVWVVVAYFPHSNIPVVLPTVRAERFWYFPVIGSSLGIALLLAWIAQRFRDVGPAFLSLPVLVISTFLGFQAVRAYMHAMDYRDDLAFWYATKRAVPQSAKAHLNYSVMVGARGDMNTRLVESRVAMQLAPQWAMAHIYTGDTLCRMHRAPEAWPHYARGFDLGPNDRSLISLALQCMYDEKILLPHDEELRKISDKHPGSWIAYLAVDTLNNHEKNKGVDPKYRPRGYNEGPKE